VTSCLRSTWLSVLSEVVVGQPLEASRRPLGACRPGSSSGSVLLPKEMCSINTLGTSVTDLHPACCSAACHVGDAGQVWGHCFE